MKISHSLLSIGVLCCLLIVASHVAQAARHDTVTPRYDSSAFRLYYPVSTPDSVVVPTVVEVPIERTFELPRFVIEDQTSGEVISHYYRVEREREPTSVGAYSDGRQLLKLTDDDYVTSTDFQLTEEGRTMTTIRLEAAAPITSSEITLSLAQNVALPQTVQLTAQTEHGEETVIATRKLTSSLIRFPKTTARIWRLGVTHSQPLRLNEIHIAQDGVAEHTSRSVRFLAQPGHTYRVYADPDRVERFQTQEGGNLRDDEGVVTIAPVSPVQNPTYVIADSDNDGVPDIHDNCVSVDNAEQTDIDGNGRGDQCDDFDRDGIENHRDNCVNEPNRRQEDEDGDGIGDRCDEEESRVTEKYWWIPWAGLGFAAVVILGMFLIMLRRPEEMDVDTVSSEDTTNDSP